MLNALAIDVNAVDAVCSHVDGGDHPPEVEPALNCIAAKPDNLPSALCSLRL